MNSICQITAGPYSVIRLFDIEQGMAIQDIPVGGGTITSMVGQFFLAGYLFFTLLIITFLFLQAQATVGSNIILTGGSDGILRSFDYRVSSRAAYVFLFSLL